MGLRGPGAKPLKRRREGEAKPSRRLPWKRKGLTLAEQMVAFLEFLPVTKGRLRGKRMKLLPTQREFVEAVFAADAKGKRPVSLAILSEAKGNGKTGLVAGICLAGLLGPLSEERGAVYSASIDRGKAGIIFEEMKAVILRVPEFADRVNITDFHKRMRVMEGDGYDTVFEALSADARRSQGLAPTLWAYDELGEAPSGELLNVLLESEGKRDKTLGIVLSTQAADDAHPLSRLIDDALTANDPAVYLQLHVAPADADPFADETLKAANPAWGHFLDLEALQKSRDRARRMPAFEPTYRRLRLNQRIDTNAEARILPAGVWRRNADPVDRAALKGRLAFGGLDLSGKHDLTALVLVFPDADGCYDVLPIFWTPQDQLAARPARERENFELWTRQGHMIAVPGPTIRSGWVAAEMARLATEFDIRAIAFDRWRVDDLKQDLADIGCKLDLQPRGQGFRDQGPDIEVLAELAMHNRLRHGAHPVLTAAMSNAVTESDPAGNLKIAKDKSHGAGVLRVDGAVALAMAVGLASRTAPKKPSVYQSRGVFSLSVSA